MANTSSVRRIELILLKPDGSIKINDAGSFCSDDHFDWRYNMCLSHKENIINLLRLVYNESDVEFTVTPELQQYMFDRQNVATIHSKAYHPVIKAIRESDISDCVKYELFESINAEIYRLNPYICK